MLRTPRLNILCLAFLLAMGGLNGGAMTVVFFGQRYLGWQQQQIGTYIAIFSATGGLFNLILHPLISKITGRRPSDLTMVRCAYVGPVMYFAILSAMSKHASTLAYALLPLFSLGATATPHFRGLFSRAQADEAQGEQMALVAALESLPNLYASPLASLGFRACLHTPWMVLVGAGVVLPSTAILTLWLCVGSPPQPRDRASGPSAGLLSAINDDAARDGVPVIPIVRATTETIPVR